MEQPNFVFIMTDTQGADVVGCYGQDGVQTNNLGRLASQGARFERAYTTCPLCTPARGGIFTGLTPSVNGAHTNNMAPGRNIRTMGHYFRRLGYRTAYIGKWHLDGLDYFDSGICPEEWEEEYWFDGRRYLSELTDEQTALWRQGLKSIEALRENNIGPDFTWAHRSGDRAIQFLENVEDNPFLLVVSYDEPHGPHTCPAEYVEQFEDFAKPIGPPAHDTLENKPAHQKEWAERVGRDPEQESYRNPLYFGCNSFVDDEIGRILNAIDRLAPENTYVIYTSDHGSMQGAHRLDSKGPVMYEEITHIPLIIRCPEAEDEHVIRSPVSHLDLLPTMLDIAGEEIPPLLQGKSLLPELHGQKSETTAAERNIMIEFTRYAINHDGWGGYQPVRSLVKGKYKLVLNLLHTDELYDLEKDPDELENLIDDPGSEDLRRRLHEELLAEMDRLRDPFRGPCWERQPWCDTRNKKWQGPRRPRPCSLFEPISYDYGTGRPHDG